MNNVIIREYKVDDKSVILNLLRLNTPQYFSPEEETHLAYYLENKIESYFVIVFDDTLIGCGGINFSDDRSTGILSWDILHPDFQRKGLGTLLLKYRIDKLKNINGVNKIIVRTSQLTYKFYKRSGFKLVEQIKDYWANGFDLYKMEFLEM